MPSESGLQPISYPEAAKVALAKILDEYIASAEAFRAASWSADHATHQRMYECIPKIKDPIWPWRGAASNFFPLGRAATDAHVSQEHDAHWTNDPFVKLTAIESNDVLEAEQLSIYYGDFLDKKLIKMRAIGGDYSLQNAIDGTTMLIPTWERSLRTRIENRIEQEPIYQTTESQFLGLSTRSKQIVGYKDIPTERFVVDSVDRPNLTVGDVDRLFMSPETGTTLQAEDCPWYYIENEWDLATLRDRRARKGWDFGTADDFGKLQLELTARTPTEKERIKRLADGLSGSEVGKSIRALEFYMPLALPGDFRVGDKITSQNWDDEDAHTLECIVTYLPLQRRIVRIVPLQRVYPDGKRPHILSQWCRRHNHPYGMGTMARARQMNKFINQCGNQMMDRGTLETMAITFYNPSQTGVLPDMTSVQPGQFVPVSGDPRGIFQPRMATGAAEFYMAMMDMGKAWNEMDSSVNDFTRKTTSPGTNTARGQAMMMQVGKLMFSRLTSQHAEPVAEAYQRIHELHRRYSKDQIFTVTGVGAEGFKTLRIPRRAFDQDISFEFVTNPDRAWDQQVAEKVLAFFSQVPEVMSNPDSKRELFRDFYEVMGKKNFNRIYTVQSQMMPGQQPGQPGMMPPGQQPMMGPAPLPGAQAMPPGMMGSNVLPFPQQPAIETTAVEVPSEEEQSVKLAKGGA